MPPPSGPRAASDSLILRSTSRSGGGASGPPKTPKIPHISGSLGQSQARSARLRSSRICRLTVLAVYGRRTVVMIPVPRRRTLVVEHEADNLRRLEHVERFLDQLPVSAMSGDDNQETVDPVSDQAAIG